MPSINITETDLTVSNTVLSDTDIVYIPGFVSNTYQPTDPLVEAFVPTLCTTVAEFTNAFGSVTPTVTGCNSISSGYDAKALPNGVGLDLFENSDDPSTRYDVSYIMAIDLLSMGIPVVYERVNDVETVTIEGSEVTQIKQPDFQLMMTALGTVFGTNPRTSGAASLDDVTAYDIKYVTSGGYPVFEYSDNIAGAMETLANKRGDCVALIDATPYSSRTLYATDTNSIYGALADSSNSGLWSSYGAMFPEWAKSYTSISAKSSTDGAITGNVPGSFVYLISLATSIRNNPNWLAIAGVSRGLVPYIGGVNTLRPVTAAIANSYQGDEKVSINAIANIPNYGNCIWGNRTLASNNGGLTAFSFLNVRNIVSDIKKLAYKTAMSLVFEQNSNLLKTAFKTAMTPTLARMVSGNALSNYSFSFSNAGKNKLDVTITLSAIYPVEDFNIGIVMTDDGVTVE